MTVYRRNAGSSNKDCAVSPNIAYGEVQLEPVGGIYEDPDKIVKSVNEESFPPVKQPTAGGYSVDQPSVSDYDTVGENIKHAE